MDHIGNDNFSFQFEIKQSAASSSDDGPVLQEFVRQQIEALLDIVVLTSCGEPVNVDGFIWMKDAFCRMDSVQPEPISLSREE